MLIGLLIVLLDLAAGGGLLAGLVVIARRRRWTSLIALLAGVGLLVLGNVRVLTSAYEQGRPAPASVAGTWTDSDGATLRVQLAGTFTAAGLPADADDPAGDGRPHPADGRGTWQITRGDGTWYALFTLSGGAQFRLDGWTTSGATFSYVFPRYNAVDLWAFYRR